MAKLHWAIINPDYGHQFDVVANTRADAIAQAEAKYLADNAWEDDVVGEIDDDGVIITRSPIPAYTAKKLQGAGGRALG